VQLLRQAALQEFKVGSPERGRAVFESLLRNNPKRTDLWSLYIDQVWEYVKFLYCCGDD
jgi:rRNA biogenesis protein RRP5